MRGLPNGSAIRDLLAHFWGAAENWCPDTAGNGAGGPSAAEAYGRTPAARRAVAASPRMPAPREVLIFVTALDHRR
jgi:hypothetical protein